MTDTKARNSSLDALRCLAMLGIVLGHFYIHGLHGQMSYNGLNLLLTSLAVMGVNLFFLLSGYFSISRERVSWVKLGHLWILTVFYGVLFAVIFQCTKHGNVTQTSWTKSFLGLFDYSQYWFITIYAVVYVFSPYLNRLLNTLEKKEYIRLLMLLTIVFSVVPTFFSRTILINPIGHCSLQWACVLYSWGGYLRRFGMPVILRSNRFFPWVLFWGCLFVLMGIRILSNTQQAAHLFSGTKLTEVVGSYNNSPFVLALSLTCFILFTQLNIRNVVYSRISPYLLGVYLIHENPFMRSVLWGNILQSEVWIHSFWLPVYAVVCTLVVFCLSLSFDFIRHMLVRWIILRS